MMDEAQSAARRSRWQQLRAGISGWLGVLGQAAAEYGTHDGPWLAGAMAYYAAFSVLPLLLLLVSILGLVLRTSPGAHDAQNRLLELIARASTPALASQVDQILSGVKLGAGLGGPLGLLGVIVGAGGIFAALDAAFDRLWDIGAPQTGGLLATIKMLLFQRLAGFVMLLGLGLLLAAAFVASLLLSTLGAAASQPAAQAGWQVLQILLVVAVNAAVLTVIYVVLPKPDVRWADAWPAGLLVAVVWQIGEQVLAWIVIGQNYIAYGVIGAFIALMAWIYYACVIFFFGAEVVRVRCRLDDTGACAGDTASPAVRRSRPGRLWRSLARRLRRHQEL